MSHESFGICDTYASRQILTLYTLRVARRWMSRKKRFFRDRASLTPGCSVLYRRSVLSAERSYKVSDDRTFTSSTMSPMFRETSQLPDLTYFHPTRLCWGSVEGGGERLRDWDSCALSGSTCDDRSSDILNGLGFGTNTVWFNYCRFDFCQTLIFYKKYYKMHSRVFAKIMFYVC